MSTNVKKYTDLQIIERVESLPSFKGWKKGCYDIWIRSNEDEYNRFDDKAYSYEVLKEGERPKFIMVCTGTTNPGAQGLKHFEKYNELGCGVALADYIGYNTHMFGLHGKSKVEAYIQVYNGIQYPYTRDNDKDQKSENYGKIYWNRIGLNDHPAGEESTQIDGWSVACLVRNIKKQFKAWMKFMNKRPLSVCILNEW